MAVSVVDVARWYYLRNDKRCNVTTRRLLGFICYAAVPLFVLHQSIWSCNLAESVECGEDNTDRREIRTNRSLVSYLTPSPSA
jgi:hypothetical protein